MVCSCFVPPSHCTTFLISFQIVGIVPAGRFSFIELMRQAETKIVHILQVLSSVADALNLQGGPEFGSSSPLSPYARQDTPSESICSPIRLPRRRPASLVSPSNSASEGDFVQLESLPRLPKELVGPRKIGRSLSDDVERRAGQEVKGSRRSSHRRQDSSKWLTTAELVLTSSRAGDARFSANKVRDSPADSDSPMFGASPAAQSPTDKLPTTLHRLYSVASSPGHRSAQMASPSKGSPTAPTTRASTAQPGTSCTPPTAAGQRLRGRRRTSTALSEPWPPLCRERALGDL